MKRSNRCQNNIVRPRNRQLGNRLSWNTLSGVMVIGIACAIGAALNPNVAMAKKAAPGAAATNTSRPGLTGLWLDHTKRGAVEITRCRSASAARKKNSALKVAAGSQGKTARKKKRPGRGALCGRIFWLKAPLDKRGRPLTDKLNAKASKRKRQICGLRIIGKVKRMSRRVYDNGWIYDPEKGKYFDVELTLKSNNILQVKGYKGIKLLSKTFLWRRLKPGQLKPCAP